MTVYETFQCLRVVTGTVHNEELQYQNSDTEKKDVQTTTARRIQKTMCITRSRSTGRYRNRIAHSDAVI